MSNKIFRIAENFYRAAYGQHRFLLNYIGIEMTLYKYGSTHLIPPQPPTQYVPLDDNDLTKWRTVLGPSFNAPSLYRPEGTVKVLTKIYSMSQYTEETSDLGDVTAYAYDNKIEKGDMLRTTIGDKIISFKVIDKKTIGFGKHIVYELTLRPEALVNNNVTINNSV